MSETSKGSRKWAVRGIAGLIMICAVVGGAAFFSEGSSDSESESATSPPSGNVQVPEGPISDPVVTLSPDLGNQDEQRAAHVVLPGDRTIPVRLRSRPERTVPHPLSLAEAYESLRKAAQEGNAESAWVLHGLLEECQKVHSDPEELAKAIDLLHQTHMIKRANRDEPSRILDPNPEKIAQFEESLREGFEYCNGVSQEQKAESNKWLAKAAEAGSSQAMLKYGMRLVERGELEEAVRVMEAAWRSGETIAAEMLSKLHKEGSSSTQGPVRADKITAYAYLSLYVGLVDASLESQSYGRVITVWLDELRHSLEKETQLMQVHELNAALEMAETILRANENCCYRL